MLELAKDGTSYSDMEEAMELKGYDKQSILDILSDPAHADMKENTLNLMRGLAQKEMVDNLANEEAGIDDAFASTSMDQPDHIDTYLVQDTAEELSEDLPAFMKTSRNLRGQCALKDFADAGRFSAARPEWNRHYVLVAALVEAGRSSRLRSQHVHDR